jgi:hypothetical protein
MLPHLTRYFSRPGVIFNTQSRNVSLFTHVKAIYIVIIYRIKRYRNLLALNLVTKIIIVVAAIVKAEAIVFYKIVIRYPFLLILCFFFR